MKGEYARIFEEEYRALRRSIPDYATPVRGSRLDARRPRRSTTDTSRSTRKAAGPDTGENNSANRDNAERAYNLIMKDKEKLLSFETPLKFIFSHSALKEGWDNPNVFQICALRDMRTERERRQTIGRGLRLCVNQEGERLRGFEVNTLTVIATESYEEFAENLQKEIEADTGIRFGIVERTSSPRIAVATPTASTAPLGFEQSKALWEHLKAAGLHRRQGQGAGRAASRRSRTDAHAAGGASQHSSPQISDVSGSSPGASRSRTPTSAGRSDAAGRAQSRVQGALGSHQAQDDLPRAVRQRKAASRTACSVARMRRRIAKTRLQWRKADIAIGKAGVKPPSASGAATVVLDEGDIELPDLLTDLQDRTQLTRRSHSAHPHRQRAPRRLQAEPAAVHRTSCRSHQPKQAPGAGRRHQVPAAGRRVLLRAGAVRARGADWLPEEYLARDEVRLRAGGVRLRHRGELRK